MVRPRGSGGSDRRDRRLTGRDLIDRVSIEGLMKQGLRQGVVRCGLVAALGLCAGPCAESYCGERAMSLATLSVTSSEKRGQYYQSTDFSR